MFGTGNCCCTPAAGCLYGSENWTYANTTSIGTQWLSVVGSWTTVSCFAQTTSSSASAIFYLTNPATSTNFVVSSRIKCSTPGDVARIYYDGGNDFTEIEAISLYSSALRVSHVGSYVARAPIGIGYGAWAALYLCSAPGKVHSGISGTPILTSASSISTSQLSIASGNVVSAVAFDDFYASKQQTDNSTCPPCGSEGCYYFLDEGVVDQVPLSTKDYTWTGTWRYGGYGGLSGLYAMSNGNLEVAFPNPYGARGYFQSSADGRYSQGYTTQKFYYNAGDSTYIEIVSDASLGCTIKVFSGGVQYGGSFYGVVYPPTLYMCFDGTVFNATFYTANPYGSWRESVALPYAPASFRPKVEISSFTTNAPGATGILVGPIHCEKYGVDPEPDITCSKCYTLTCQLCTPGTYKTFATATFYGFTSIAYDCPCNTLVATLTAGVGQCGWYGSVVRSERGCLEGYSVGAVLTVVGSTQVFQVSLNGNYQSAYFSESMAGGAVDCTNALNGDVPLVSISTPGPWATCLLTSAKCDFRIL